MFKNHFSVYKKWCGYLEKNFNTWLSVWLVWVGRLIKLQIWTGYWKYWGRINDFQALECPLIWVLFRLQGIKLSLDLKFLQPWREQAHCLDSAATSLNPWLSAGRGQRRGNCWTWLLSVWTAGPQSHWTWSVCPSRKQGDRSILQPKLRVLKNRRRMWRTLDFFPPVAKAG